MQIPRMACIGGAGKIGTAIVNGLLAARAIAPSKIVVTARHAESLVPWRGRGVRATLNNLAAIRSAKAVLLCIHPEDTQAILEEVSPALNDHHVVISLVTGVSTDLLEEWCGRTVRLVRAMPNMPVMVGQSMTCLAKGVHAGARDLQIAQRIFRAVGEVEVLDEKHMNAATGLGGCGPAFAFKIIEALADGGIKVGIPRAIARRMAAQVLKGAAELVLQTALHPAQLREQVATPGGCTIDGLARLEERGLSIALIDAVETATIKAGKLFARPENS